MYGLSFDIFLNMNIFRFVGDLFHLFAMLILLFKIIKTKSCTGISGRSQILLALVFIIRYSDLFTVFLNEYNTSLKVTFIVCTLTSVILIYGPYRHTYDRKHDTVYIELIQITALVFALFIHYAFTWNEMAWSYSIYLEAIAMIPQLFLTRKMGFTKYMKVYIISLGLYRSFYILNWIYRYVHQNHYDIISVTGGTTQVFIYILFLFYGHKTDKELLLENTDEKEVLDTKKSNSIVYIFDEQNRQMFMDYFQRKQSGRKDKGNASNNTEVLVHM